MRIIFFLACLAAFFCWGSAAALAGAAVIYPLPEVKLFALQERTVAAVAIEHRLPGKDIEDVLGYQLTPVFEAKKTAGAAWKPVRMTIYLNHSIQMSY